SRTGGPMRPIARPLLGALLAAALLAPAARAGDGGSWLLAPAPWVGDNCSWDQGCWSVQFVSGYYAMSSIGPGSTPFGVSAVGRARVDYVPLSLRLGYECPWLMLPDTCLQGTWEALLEYDALAITRDFGSYFTGPCALAR